MKPPLQEGAKALASRTSRALVSADSERPENPFMRIFRSNPEERFTILPNATLQDDRLSFVARGILAELISRPDGWDINADALWQQAKRRRGKKSGEGREAIRAAFVELEQYGYLVRRRIRRDGRINTALDLYDTPGHRAPEASAHADDREIPAGQSGSSGSRDDHKHRGTDFRASESRASESRASENPACKERTDTQRTELQSTEDKHSSTLADARVAAADAAARDQEAELHRLYKAVNRLTPADLGNALLAIEKNRPRIYRACRNDAIGQFRKDSPGILKAADAEREVDLLSYKYALKHYPPTKRPTWLVGPLAGLVPLESVRRAS